MSNRSLHFALAICIHIPPIFADRFAALEDAAQFDHESISTAHTPSSRSIIKSLSFIISWMVAILVLRITVLLVGNAFSWLSVWYVNMRDDLLADNGIDDDRSRVKRLYKDCSVGSIGSLSELLHFDDQSAYSGGDSFVSSNYSYSTGWTEGGSLDEQLESAYTGDGSSVLSRLTGFSSVFGGTGKKQRHNGGNWRDEEEGSYVSRFGSSTVTSIRSRFANPSKRSDNNESSGYKSKGIAVSKPASNHASGDSNLKSGNTSDRREKQSKQGKGTQQKQKPLDNYLSKQDRNATATFAKKSSMAEVNQKSRKSRG